MKHLKRFNESVAREDLKKFTKDYLVYLLDSGFETEITIEGDDDGNGLWCSTIYKGGGDDEETNYFDWDDVKYDVIPFFEMLIKKFPVYGDVYFYKEKGIDFYTISEIINTDIEFKGKIHSVEFYVKMDLKLI